MGIEVPFDPLDGCMQCKWTQDNFGVHLDEMCDLHQKISDLQADLYTERSFDTSAILRTVSAVIGASEDDDPVAFAMLRMDEIATLEDDNERLEAALELFIKQWNACGPNSDFGRHFANVRRAALGALAMADADDDGTPCRSCGNEARSPGGYLTCECPSPKGVSNDG